MYNILIIIFINVIIIYNIYYNKINYDYFENNNILFLKKKELYDLLIYDDGYFKSFSKYDLIARNIKNINEYHKIIHISVINIKKKYESILINAIEQADIKCLQINNEWCNGLKLKQIPWKIGCIINNKYEFGLPHTRQDVIIINITNLKDISYLINTLIHEKMHIYQKLYPQDIEKYLQFNNFVKICKRNKHNLIRANPDLDNWIYKNNNNELLLGKYKNEKPKDITDVYFNPVNNYRYEHPFEKMIYDELDKNND